MDKQLEQQHRFIMNKYKNSKTIYLNKYTDENMHLFLNDFEDMSTYQIYPEMVVFQLHLAKDIVTTDSDNSGTVKDFEKLKSIYIKVNAKLDEVKKMTQENIKSGYIKSIRKNENEKLGKIRKYFGYEVIDYARDQLNINPCTTAFLKCYEILEYFKIIDGDIDAYNTFHICELPGTFILAIEHYIKTRTNIKKFKWDAQSLNPFCKQEKGAFLPDQYHMYKKNQENYHWAIDKTGNITNVLNIMYYQNKFKNMDLVTSDCGQDSSADFSKQEGNMLTIIWSQFVCAIGMLKKGGKYIAKIFTISSTKMVELVYFGTQLFEEFYITRPLKVKHTSAERYLVGINFKNNVKDINFFLDYLREFKDRKSLIDLNKIPDDFIDQINYSNKLLGYRRITNINQSIFQVINLKYINDHPEIYEYNKKMVDYYVDYFASYYKLKKNDT